MLPLLTIIVSTSVALAAPVPLQRASATDGFGYTSSTIYDLRFQQPTTSTDVNGQSVTRVYDDVGRLASVRGPYDGATPGLTFAYYPGEVHPRAVTHNQPSLPPDASSSPLPPPMTTVNCPEVAGGHMKGRRPTGDAFGSHDMAGGCPVESFRDFYSGRIDRLSK